MLEKGGEKETFLVGMQTDTATMQTSMAVHWKTKARATVWPSNPITGHKSWENHNSKRHAHSKVHCSTVYNSQVVSINQWIDKEDMMRINNRILLNRKKEYIGSFAEMWMDLESVIQNEVSQKYWCVYVESRKMVQTNLIAGQE